MPRRQGTVVVSKAAKVGAEDATISLSCRGGGGGAGARRLRAFSGHVPLSPQRSCYNHRPPYFFVCNMSTLIIPFQRCIYELKAISISQAIGSLPLSLSRAAAARAVRECGWRRAEARY